MSCHCLKQSTHSKLTIASVLLFKTEAVYSIRCRKLPRALKEWQAFEELRKTIDDFNETCPLLELMANKAMVARHWDRIATISGVVFEVDSENFFLRNLMEAPLLPNKEDIEVSVKNNCSIII